MILFIDKADKHMDHLEQEIKEHQTTNQYLVTANDNLIKEVKELKQKDEDFHHLCRYGKITYKELT